MKSYLTTTFSPSMLPDRGRALVEEADEGLFRVQVQKKARAGELIPAVGHENTAELLKRRLNLEPFFKESLYARVSLVLEPGEIVYAAIPQCRPETREFSDEEIAEAKFRFFFIQAR